MEECKVRSGNAGTGSLSGFAEVGGLAHVVGVQLLLEGLVGRLGEHALFL